MSTIFGIFNRNGEDISGEAFSSWRNAMDYWEPDATGSWVRDAVGLGHLMLWNTPESKLDSVPRLLDDESNPVVITADVRLDNRSELVRDLSDQPQLAGRETDTITDTELLLAAYQQWGVDSPGKLLGDFAFVIWDGRKQCLFCARDHVGIKQFYFHLSDTRFVFANDLKGLMQHPGIPTRINDEAVANFLTHSQLVSNTLTFFVHAQKLPPAHTLLIKGAAVQKKCYWRAEDAPGVHLPDTPAYAARLGELFEQAVHARVRSAYPVTSHLSGGLDSSCIAVIAARKLAEKGEQLRSCNWVHSPTEDDDASHMEWSNSKAIAAAEDIDHDYVDINESDIFQQISKHSIAYGDSAIFFNEYVLSDAVSGSGSRTILSGWGGDELATYHGQSYYSDLFLRGRVWKVFSEIRSKVSKKDKHGLKNVLGAFYHKVILPMTPRSLYGKMPKNQCTEPVFPFVSKSFMPMIEKQMKKPAVLSMQPQTTIRGHMLAFWNHGHLGCRAESWAASAIPKRLEYRYPLLDKRIIEFVLGVPPEHFVNDGVGRYLFRLSAEGMLPGDILWSNLKSDRHRVERTAALMLSAYKRLATDKEIVDGHSDYIDKDKLLSLLERFAWTGLDRDTLGMIVDFQTAISVIQSFPANKSG